MVLKAQALASYSAIKAVVEGGSSTSSAGADVWCGQDGVAVLTQLSQL